MDSTKNLVKVKFFLRAAYEE